MKGFLRRDLSLLRLGAWFYGILVAVAFVAPLLFARVGVSNYEVYFLMVFGVEILQSLRTYDAMDGWQGYAAAIPGGRKGMVDARYLLVLVLPLAGLGCLALSWRLSRHIMEKKEF